MNIRFRPTSTVPFPLVLLVAFSFVFVIMHSSLIATITAGSLYAHQKGEDIARNAAIIGYLRGPLFAQNDLAFLTPAERAHMTDVKGLFDGAFLLYMIALGIIVGTAGVFAFQKMWRHFDELLGRALIIGGWTLLCIAAFIAAASLLSFGRFWLLLHALLFPQGNWLFAADSALITLYPLDFFASFVTRWLSRVGAFGAAALLMGIFMRRMRHAKEEFGAQHAQDPQKEAKAKRSRQARRKR